MEEQPAPTIAAILAFLYKGRDQTNR